MNSAKERVYVVLGVDGTVKNVPCVGHSSLSQIQEIVGGYIQTIPLPKDLSPSASSFKGFELTIFANEEGIPAGLPKNPILPNYRGNLVMCLIDEEEGETIGFDPKWLSVFPEKYLETK